MARNRRWRRQSNDPYDAERRKRFRGKAIKFALIAAPIVWLANQCGIDFQPPTEREQLTETVGPEGARQRGCTPNNDGDTVDSSEKYVRQSHVTVGPTNHIDVGDDRVSVETVFGAAEPVYQNRRLGAGRMAEGRDLCRIFVSNGQYGTPALNPAVSANTCAVWMEIDVDSITRDGGTIQGGVARIRHGKSGEYEIATTLARVGNRIAFMAPITPINRDGQPSFDILSMRIDVARNNVLSTLDLGSRTVDMNRVAFSNDPNFMIIQDSVFPNGQQGKAGNQVFKSCAVARVEGNQIRLGSLN